MTTGNGHAHAPGGAATAGRAARRRLTDEAAAQLALIVGFVVLLVVIFAAQLLLNNTYGPLGEHESAGKWAAVGCGVVSGVAAVAVVQQVALWSSSAVTALLQAIDVSESWVPRPNERYACTGWTFRHYPPGTMDGSSTTYCIGLEHRIADG